MQSYPSSEELTRARTAYSGVLSDLVTVQRQSGGGDDWGGAGDYSNVATNVPAHIEPATDQSQVVGEKWGGIELFYLAFAHGTDVQQGDRIVTAGGDKIDVDGVMGPETWDIYISARGSIAR